MVFFRIRFDDMDYRPRKETILLILIGLIGLMGQLYFDAFELPTKPVRGNGKKSQEFSQRKERRTRAENSIRERIEEEELEEDLNASRLLATAGDFCFYSEIPSVGKIFIKNETRDFQSCLRSIETVVLIL